MVYVVLYGKEVTAVTHTVFHYPTRQALEQELNALGLTLPLSEDLSPLSRPLQAAGRTLQNRIAIQPMEGCDGTGAGAPGELTRRRYRRFAASGAALIWGEATAVVPEGRANPRQLMLTRENLDEFKTMTEEMRRICLRENGFEPVLILQATHSGRYAKPEGAPAPLIAYNNPLFEGDRPIDGSRVVTDDYLAALPEKFAATAVLAAEAGFDGVDLKCCHRYLISELCSAYTRPGRYGGSFENRTRLLREVTGAVKAAAPGGLFLTCRLNLYDGFPYPCGFGVTEGEGLTPDLTEAAALARWLAGEGMPLLDFTVGNPYVNPHVNRPYDRGGYIPPEHPLEGVARMMDCVARVKRELPDTAVIGSGFSYLRHHAPALAAGMVAAGGCDMAGFGRESFAYPGFAGDILRAGGMDRKKCCIACGKCTELMRAGSTAGCAVRDPLYTDIYKRDVLKRED